MLVMAANNTKPLLDWCTQTARRETRATRDFKQLIMCAKYER